MAGYIKTLYKVILKEDAEYHTYFGRDEIIFEMRSAQTAMAFERLLRKAKLPIVKVKPHERKRNPHGCRHHLKD